MIKVVSEKKMFKVFEILGSEHVYDCMYFEDGAWRRNYYGAEGFGEVLDLDAEWKLFNQVYEGKHWAFRGKKRCVFIFGGQCDSELEQI